MYLSPTALPQLLEPADYWRPDRYQAERAEVLLPSWHLVGTTADLSKSGDFITADLFGVPIQIRNFDGELRALSNVCAHRHCLLTIASCGTSPTMRCQYHGWEYGKDGRTRHIPQPKNFVPYDREATRLPSYRIETCGQLVFVCLASDGPSLREHLGDLYSRCEERFGDGWRRFLRWESPYEANWKAPIENSLESYHVPSVHPNSFREDPGESRSEHSLGPRHTWFATTLPFDAHSRRDAFFQRTEAVIVRLLGQPATRRYEQHHVFPNLLFSFTDAISLCQCVLPTGPATSRGFVVQFGRVGQGAGRRWLSNLWGKLAAGVARGILAEDMGLFAAIQRGLQSSEQRGMLGRCEERIHAFQAFMAGQMATKPERPAAVNEPLLDPRY